MKDARRLTRTRSKVLRALLRITWCLLLTSGVAGQSLAVTNAQKGAVARLTREEIIEAERRLSELGYWAGEADGYLDPISRHALTAFQKVEGRERTGRLTREELQALREAERPQPLEGGPPHVEIDIRRQVLFVVDGEGAVVRILPVSTGSEASYFDQGKRQRAHTPRGRFTVQRKINGWRLSTLGLLYYPNYFSGGFAIHGSPLVPAHPASHGCVRIPTFA
ncbi:MAG TPA: L,D-transpeptidase family protein, partial [Pyrinomonadaceae bacterium]|nr:L,D-transpeptidase family protein [Pyrinomonadaceae bacterium]